MVALVIFAAAIGIFGMRRAAPPHAVFPTQAFYTTDDGATYFVDDANREPPFDHNGQPAVRAHVFTCGKGAHKWVQYLEKFSGKSSTPSGNSNMPQVREVVVKKPGSTDWVVRGAAGCLEVMVPKAPDGCDPSTIEPLMPS